MLDGLDIAIPWNIVKLELFRLTICFKKVFVFRALMFHEALR